MTWARFDDTTDEELAYLSHAAFRLFVSGIVYSRRLQRAGRLHMVRDIKPLAARQGLQGVNRLVSELCAGTDDDKPLCEVDGDYVVWIQYGRYQPLTSAERTRKWRNKQQVSSSSSSESPDVTSQRRHAEKPGDVTVTSGDAATRARPRMGIPIPVPEPVNELFPSVRVRTDEQELTIGQAAAKAYVDACTDLGLTKPDGRSIGRVGKEAKALLEDGKPAALVHAAIREIARRNTSPAYLGAIAGDIERQQKGIDQTRKFPTRQNPVSEFIQGFSAFSDAEQAANERENIHDRT